MKKSLFFLIGSALVVSLFFLGGCSINKTSGPAYTEYQIQVDSIQHPDSIAVGKALNIKFYGLVGPSTCYSFSRFVGGVSNRNINVAVYGKYLSDLSNCTDSTQYLNGEELTVNLITSGTFVIHVYQPTAPDLYDTVYVTPTKSAVAH